MTTRTKQTKRTRRKPPLPSSWDDHTNRLHFLIDGADSWAEDSPAASLRQDIARSEPASLTDFLEFEREIGYWDDDTVNIAFEYLKTTSQIEEVLSGYWGLTPFGVAQLHNDLLGRLASVVGRGSTFLVNQVALLHNEVRA